MSVMHSILLVLMEFQSTEASVENKTAEGRAQGQPCCRTGDEMQAAGVEEMKGCADW